MINKTNSHKYYVYPHGGNLIRKHTPIGEVVFFSKQTRIATPCNSTRP